MSGEASYVGLPGWDLVEEGLAQLRRGELAAEALLVLIAGSRLRDLGVPVPVDATPAADPERALYDLLAARDADAAHEAFNALRRRIVSFAEALEGRQRRGS